MLPAKDQCLKYPFPAGTDEKDQTRLQTLKVRQERIQKVVHEEEKDWETGKVSLLHWEVCGFEERANNTGCVISVTNYVLAWHESNTWLEGLHSPGRMLYTYVNLTKDIVPSGIGNGWYSNPSIGHSPRSPSFCLGQRLGRSVSDL